METSFPFHHTLQRKVWKEGHDSEPSKQIMHGQALAISTGTGQHRRQGDNPHSAIAGDVVSAAGSFHHPRRSLPEGPTHRG